MKTKFRFHGRNEVLNIINTGGNLVEYLSTSSEACPLIGSEIKLIKKLGEGKYGIAFLIKIEGMGEKEYVAKVNKQECFYETINIGRKQRTLQDIANEFEEEDMIPSKTFISLNGGNPNKVYKEGSHKFVYPSYAKMCLTPKVIKYKRLDGLGEVIIPKGSYICKAEEYSEYVIGILCGNLYRKGVSVNFLDIFGFSSCPSKNYCLSRQYVFMEKSGVPLRSFIKNHVKNISDKTEDKTIEVIFIQILHAIAVYQKYHKIQHNDLHVENILIEHISSDTIYQNQKLHECDWFHYKIYDTDIYLPRIDTLIKIIDFGLSVKYSRPIVGNKRSLKEGQSSSKKGKPWVPNWYAESSDVIYMTDDFYSYTSPNIFVQNILGWMLGLDGTNLRKKIVKEKDRNFTSGGERPDIDMLSGKYSRGTSANVLQNYKLMSKYLKVPKEGKIATLGYIS